MKRPIWKVLAVVAAVFLVLIASLAFRIRSTAERKFAAMEARLQALRAEALVPDPSPRPGAVPGNAWDDYVAGLKEAAKIQPPEKLIALIDRTGPSDAAFGQAALAAHGQAVDLIVSGSRRASSLPPGNAALPALWQWEPAIRLAILKSRFLQEEGKLEAAVEILLAFCRFALDLSGTGVAYACTFPYRALDMVLEELRDLLTGHVRSRELLVEADVRLARLDDTFPRPEKLRVQQAQLVAEWNGRLQNPRIGAALMSWRFGFSPRLLRASEFERWEHWFNRSAAADRLPWPQAQTLIAGIRADIDRTRFMGTDGDLPSAFLPDGSLARAARAHLRLLRIAVHYRATGEALDLEDPFGTRLVRNCNLTRIKTWSVGQDGADQGGQGGWISRPVDDIVLHAER